MKKITLILILLLTFSESYSQIVNEPANWPNTDWTVEGTNLGDPDVLEADPTLTANFAYDDDDAGSGSDDEVSAASPIIDLTAAANGGETWLTVSGNYTHRYLTNDYLIFQYWDADNDTWNDWGAPFTETTTAAPTGNYCSVAGVPYTSEVLNIFNFTATQLSGFKYRIYYNDDLNGSDWNYGFCFGSPTLTSETPPTCPVVTVITVSNITGTTADITWVAGNSETAWEVAVQPVDTGEPTGSGEVATTNSFTATGLSAVTEYEVYVRANCDADGFSNWEGPVNFMTACDIFVPFYQEDFSTITPNCWEEASNGTATTGPLEIGSSSWISDGFLNNGSTGAYKINLWSTGKSDWILSPQFDLTGGPFQVDFDFAIMKYGSSTLAGTLGSDDTVQLFISDDNGASWTTLVTYDNTSVVPASGTQVVYDLSAYSGQIVQFGILGSEGSVNDTEDNDVFVDNFRVREIPTCPEPTDLAVTNITATTADISWTAFGGTTDWEVIVQPVATGMPTGSGVATTTNPYTVTGLSAVTEYEVYIRADCGADDFSIWVGPVDFMTACDIFVPFYLEDFSTITPNCWEEADNGTAATGPLEIGSSSWTSDGFLNNGFTGAYKINLYASSRSDWILSPQFDLTGGPFQVDFDFAIMKYSSSTVAGMLGSDDTVQLFISADNGASWTAIVTYDNTSVVSPSGIQVVYDLSAYSGQIVQFGILGSEGTVNDTEDNDVFVDNFRVREIPTCPEPSDLAVANITATTADLNWNAFGGTTSWEIINQLAGTAAPTASDSGMATSDNPYQVSGLVAGTNYEFYVRAICGTDDVSLWVGPFGYRIDGPGETCEDPILVTTPLPYIHSDNTSNYLDDYNGSAGPDCGSTFGSYLNGDDVVYAYTPDAETSVDIEVTNLTDTYAGVFVYTDCADIGTNCQNGAVNSSSTNDLFIDDYILTGGTTYYIVISTWASPQSTGYTLTIRENTCIDPTASYQVVNDCENGDQFLLNVNISSLGDAETLTISNDYDATTVDVTETGIYQVGPFPFLIDVAISVNNDQDSNCFLNETFQLLACPPDNDNPCEATEVAVNTDSSCDLTTSGTLLEATPSGVPTGSCSGDPDDDVWFQFVAQSEVQLISILNNTGTFNIDHALYEGSCDGLVELACSDSDASVSPQLVVGNTYYLRVFSGGSNPETNTFDICIKKAPNNLICENAVNFCAEDGGALTTPNIIGIPDSNSIACLSTAPNPTWNIIQIGNGGLIEIQIDQVDEQGNGLDVDYVLWGPFESLDTACGNLDLGCPDPSDCPGLPYTPEFYPYGNIADCSYSIYSTETLTIDNALSGEIYILLVTNYSNDPGTISIMQTNGGTDTDGTITAEIEVELGDDQEFCGFPEYVLNADSPFADTYEWYANGFIIPEETESTLTVTESDIYTVIAYDAQCGSQAEDSVTITFGKEAQTNPVDDIVTCDDASGDNVENFDLEEQTATILGDQDPSVFNVTYYLTLQDAQTSTNPLTSPYNNVSNPQTIFVRVEDANANFCFATTSFDLLISGPTPTVASVDIEACEDGEGIADFDLASHDVNILGEQSPSDFTVSYYENEADAEAGANAIDASTLYTSTSKTLYARVESNMSFDCYSTTAFDLVAKPLPSTSFAEDFDYEVCPDATVPIMITASPNNYSASEVTIEWYRDGGLISGENNLSLAVLEAGFYQIKVIFNDATQCESLLGVDVIELENCIIPEGISPNGDGKNDTFDLSSYNVSKLEIFNRYGTRVYKKLNYTNEWHGQTDDGDELPVGTYFYSMEYENGKQRSAWVYIQRLN